MTLVSLLLKDCLVDEDGRFTTMAGPQLQGLPVMTEGTDTGKVSDLSSDLSSV